MTKNRKKNKNIDDKDQKEKNSNLTKIDQKCTMAQKTSFMFREL